MQREVDWIIAALARDPTKTKSGLARALGIDKSGVSRLLGGGRRLKYAEASKAAEYLGCEPGGGFAEPAQPYLAEPRLAAAEPHAPLYAACAGEDGFWRLNRSAAIESRPRAPQFAGAALVFGFYAPDDAMAPRFRTGEIVWANPARAAGPGADALFAPTDAPASAHDVFLAVLESAAPDYFEARQYGGGARRLKRSDWQAIYVFDRG